jgi:hypothetical protein
LLEIHAVVFEKMSDTERSHFFFPRGPLTTSTTTKIITKMKLDGFFLFCERLARPIDVVGYYRRATW